jgi:hypothetical protein
MFSDGRAESVLESCARVVFHQRGLEPPELQVTIHGNAFAFRVDFCWPGHRTIVEADGLVKYSDRRGLLEQFRRDQLLREAGYKVVHFTWRELFDTPANVVARIQAAFSSPTPFLRLSRPISPPHQPQLCLVEELYIADACTFRDKSDRIVVTSNAKSTSTAELVRKRRPRRWSGVRGEARAWAAAADVD